MHCAHFARSLITVSLHGLGLPTQICVKLDAVEFIVHSAPAGSAAAVEQQMRTALWCVFSGSGSGSFCCCRVVFATDVAAVYYISSQLSTVYCGACEYVLHGMCAYSICICVHVIHCPASNYRTHLCTGTERSTE